MSAEETLKERGQTYGSFTGYARQLQSIKDVTGLEASNLDCTQKAAMDMIFCKISRLLNGDPNHIDSWLDIAGYATLIVKELEKDF